ncbi:MAG: hypothetical protein L6R39_000991 [Caloplaca ligustica]|nr:MAG: hypothetical protein L6R39_000991 [Caloplaca ligustica]
MRMLKRKFKVVEQFVSELDPKTVTFKPLLEGTDPRVTDITTADLVQLGDNAYNLTQLRRMLSLRSMALEYNAWERQEGRTSTLDKRITQTDTCTQNTARVRVLNKFLERRFTPAYERSVKKTIQLGVRLLVLESILRDSGGPGCSVILALSYHAWRRWTFKDVTQFADEFRSQSSMTEFARRSADWLLQWQKKYDSKFSKNVFSELTSVQNGAKVLARLEEPLRILVPIQM